MSCSIIDSKNYAYLTDIQAVQILAFVGGFVDSAGYVKLQGIFTSSITGNLVAATSSVTTTEGVLSRALVTIAFMVAAGIATYAMIRLTLVNKWRSASVYKFLYAAEILFLVISWILGTKWNGILDSSTNMNQSHVIIIGMMMGASMGVHNVVAKESIPNCPPTTVMTSTLVNVANTFSNWTGYHIAKLSASFAGDKDTDDAKERIGKYEKKSTEMFAKWKVTIRPAIFFLLGGVVGGFGTHYGDFTPMVIPVVLILVLMVSTYIKAEMMEYQKSMSSRSFEMSEKAQEAQAVEKAEPIGPAEKDPEAPLASYTTGSPQEEEKAVTRGS
jgi:uncharacterized membrane protein YoaK (UPF0700 family)